MLAFRAQARKDDGLPHETPLRGAILKRKS
jgi:hypothetical protein